MTDTDILPGEEKRRQGRKTFIGILLAFFGPLALAIFLFANLDMWKPQSTANHGLLLEPIRPIPFLQLQQVDGGPLKLEDLLGRWSLIYVAEGECDLLCQTDLFKMRQASAELARDLVRVQDLYIALDDAAGLSGSSLKQEHPKMLLGGVEPASRIQQAEAFESQPQGMVYLLDPLGNLVLRYDDNSTTKGIIKDLKKLLKVSKIG